MWDPPHGASPAALRQSRWTPLRSFPRPGAAGAAAAAARCGTPRSSTPADAPVQETKLTSVSGLILPVPVRDVTANSLAVHVSGR